MKKQLLLMALFFCAFFLVNAQNDTIQNKSYAGLKGGYNLAAVSFDGDDETGQRHGFHIGFYGETYLNKVAAIQVEILYSQQGYQITRANSKFTQKLDYINVPLLLKIYPTENFFLEAGPQIGLAISHKEEYDSDFNLLDSSKEKQPNNFDYGVNFGGGFKTGTGLSFGVRYHLGLGDIYEENKPQNRVWMFSLGFDF